MRKPSFFTLIVLIAALGALWWGLGFDDRAKDRDDAGDFFSYGDSADDGAFEEGPPDERGDVPQGSSGEEEEAGAPVGDFRATVIAGVERDAVRLLPENAGIARLWFATDRETYVEYRRSGAARADRMAFVVASGSAGSLAFLRAALYGLNESDGWELIEGDEVLYTKPQHDLYERNAAGEWKKRN